MNKRLLTLLFVGITGLLFAQDPALYRTIDGTQNNVNNPDWGAAHTALLQLAGVGFSDGFSSPAGSDRPNARFLSNLIFDQPELLPDPMTLSDYTWVFGQFMDHDLGLTEGTEEPFDILVPQGDPDLDPLGFGNIFIRVNRTKFVEGTGTDINNPAQFDNEVTAFIDASSVYGSDQERADWLRSFVDGKMKVSAGNLLPYNTIDGEFASDVDPNAPFMGDEVGFSPRLFVAGDVRANENPLLLSFHTLFVREHNRRAEIIKAEHPDWTDEEIYQLARKYVGGHMQAITFNEWLPAMGVPIEDYTGYDSAVHPQLSNTFTAAAFRVGHTLLNSLILRVDNNGNELPQGHMLLRNGFFNVGAIAEVGGLDPYLAGMAQQVQQTMDSRIVDDIRNFLFGPPGAGGTDLASINIARGRERGLPTFNAIRQAYGLAPYFFLEQINSDLNVYAQLFQAYFGDINKVDPWIGMLAESPMPGALFGQTLLAIMAKQFSDLRDGDRFFYLNDPVLTAEEKAYIDQTTFRDIIMHNTGISLMQDNVFLAMPYGDICGSATSNIQGGVQVQTTGVALPDVQINYLLEGTIADNLITNAAGTFEFLDLPACEAGTLSPVFSNDTWINGVTVQDIVKISRHILGIEDLPNPYQLLAADVNLDGFVRVTDIIAIRRLILDLDQSLPTDAPMWNFIPADYVFTDPTAPWDDDYPTELVLPSPAMNLESQRFVAYKRGDVNATAIIGAENFSSNPELLASRSGYGLKVITEDRVTTAGEATKISFHLSLDPTIGSTAEYQFELAGEGLSFAEIVLEETSKPGAIHLNERGALRFCGEVVAGTVQQFTILVTSDRSAPISTLLKVNQTSIPAFAVADLDPERAVGVHLDYQSSQGLFASNAPELGFAVYPNPFTDRISFALSPSGTAGLATLELYSADGRRVLHEQRQLPPLMGQNWTVDVAHLPAGIYTYELVTAADRYVGQLNAASR